MWNSPANVSTATSGCGYICLYLCTSKSASRQKTFSNRFFVLMTVHILLARFSLLITVQSTYYIIVYLINLIHSYVFCSVEKNQRTFGYASKINVMYMFVIQCQLFFSLELVARSSIRFFFLLKQSFCFTFLCESSVFGRFVLCSFKQIAFPQEQTQNFLPKLCCVLCRSNHKLHCEKWLCEQCTCE